MSEKDFEEQQFTQTAILFSLTGHIFFRGDVSNEYYDRSMEEIKTDAVYRHVMSTVPENMKYSLWEMCDSDARDVDPILEVYLNEKLPRYAQVVKHLESLTLRESVMYLEKHFLVPEQDEHAYVGIRPITFKELTNIAEDVNRRLNAEEVKK